MTKQKNAEIILKAKPHCPYCHGRGWMALQSDKINMTRIVPCTCVGALVKRDTIDWAKALTQYIVNLARKTNDVEEDR